MTTTYTNHQTGQQQPYTPPPVEWSSDHTARMVTRIAGDVASIKKWVTFFGIMFILWLAVGALVLITTIGALSNTNT